jgi:hypothetical protein
MLAREQDGKKDGISDKRGSTTEKGEEPIMSKLIELPGKQQREWTGWNWSLWYRWVLEHRSKIH